MSGRRRTGKLGIALAGGGPLGGIYEIGALLALEEALKGVTLTECDVYVGVSSGAFVAAGLRRIRAAADAHAGTHAGGRLRLFRNDARARRLRIVRSADARPAERPLRQ